MLSTSVKILLILSYLILTAKNDKIYSSTFQLKKLLEFQALSFDYDKCEYFNWKNFNSYFVSEHPVAAFVFIKCLNQQTGGNVHEIDLKGAALSLVRIQDVYNFEIGDIISGKLGGYSSNVSLNFDDCAFIAQQAFFNLQLEAAERWLQYCNSHFYNKQTQINIDNKLMEKRRVVEGLAKSISSVRDMISSNNSLSTEMLKVILKAYPDFSSAALTILTENKHILQMKSRLTNNCNLLCLGLEPPWTNKTNLTCYMMKHRLFTYYPILVEIVSHQPQVLIYHKIVNNYEIRQLKNAVANKLQMTKTHRFGDRKTEMSSARVGQMAWISPVTNQLVNRIYKRLQLITELNVESAEEFQVLNYGLGGHYEIHMDFFDSNKKGEVLPTGDRIATALFYLNDVKAGGSTVFPELGVAVKPIKGAALIWRNLLDDGSGDYRTLHAACPVVTGTKWVGNLWFHEQGQQTLLRTN